MIEYQELFCSSWLIVCNHGSCITYQLPGNVKGIHSVRVVMEVGNSHTYILISAHSEREAKGHVLKNTFAQQIN